MKQLQDNSSNPLFSLLEIFFFGGILLLHGPLYAEDILTPMKGEVFIKTQSTSFFVDAPMKKKRPYTLFLEEASQLRVQSAQKNSFVLNDNSHLVLEENDLTLKNGRVWIKTLPPSNSPRAPMPPKRPLIKTANAHVYFKHAEFIVTFKPEKQKTQILVLNGTVEFFNPFFPNKKALVGPGQISFISKHYDQETPRPATEVGHQSFLKLTGLFQGISPEKWARPSTPVSATETSDNTHDIQKDLRFFLDFV